MKNTVLVQESIAAAYEIYRKGDISLHARVLYFGGTSKAMHDSVIPNNLEMERLDRTCIAKGMGILRHHEVCLSIMEGELVPVEIDIDEETMAQLAGACLAAEVNHRGLSLEKFGGLCLALGFHARQDECSSKMMFLCEALDRQQEAERYGITGK